MPKINLTIKTYTFISLDSLPKIKRTSRFVNCIIERRKMMTYRQRGQKFLLYWRWFVIRVVFITRPHPSSWSWNHLFQLPLEAVWSISWSIAPRSSPGMLLVYHMNPIFHHHQVIGTYFNIKFTGFSHINLTKFISQSVPL